MLARGLWDGKEKMPDNNNTDTTNRITSYVDGGAGLYTLRVGPVTITLVSAERSFVFGTTLLVQHAGCVEAARIETPEDALQLMRWISALNEEASIWSRE